MPKSESCFKKSSAISTKNIEQYAYHLLFTFYPFRDKVYLKSPAMTGTYFVKLQEPGLMDIISRNRAIIEPLVR